MAAHASANMSGGTGGACGAKMGGRGLNLLQVGYDLFLLVRLQICSHNLDCDLLTTAQDCAVHLCRRAPPKLRNTHLQFAPRDATLCVAARRSLAMQHSVVLHLAGDRLSRLHSRSDPSVTLYNSATVYSSKKRSKDFKSLQIYQFLWKW